MITLIPDRYKPEVVTSADLVIASVAWGFTLGIGWLTTWTAIRQTANAYRRRGWSMLSNAYVWMIWGEIAVCLSFGIICFMNIMGVIPPSFAFFFCILTLWALQVQFLLQIIVNRCGILLTDQRLLWRVKWGTAALITAINISVYCIWIPARLQISDEYVHINEIWDRCEKVIYLLVDAALNIFFIRIVKQNLVENGLHKYNNLVKFNMFIIGFSLGMDVLIVAMMSLKNSFVYMQFHPLAYIVKLNIEMSMATLIAKIARNSEHHQGSSGYNQRSHGLGTQSKGETLVTSRAGNMDSKSWPTVTTTIEMNTMERGKQAPKSPNGFNNDTDMLIDQSAPYSVQVNAQYSSQSRGPKTKRGADSLSSEGTNESETV
ncbi:unnamed protein product [Clonostachys rhizophaga]|uniref:Transmembrane protein n=1 Tax=Clonostachys rhizophaga TaxID=160324 RepID=A0A9N9VW63_9HYPO|nr:unnamed protein product [Clonostachys rhizophaga]